MISYSSFLQGVADTLDITPEHLSALELSGDSVFDSMGKITIALYIEETFGWQIPLTVLDECTTLDSLYRTISESIDQVDA